MKKSNIKVIPNPQIQQEEIGRIGQSQNYNFREFSEIPEYRKVNEDFLKKAIDFLPKNKPIFHVDNATGTGLVPQLSFKIYANEGRKATIIGIDPDLYAIKKAAEVLSSTENIKISFIQGYGQELVKILKGIIPKEGVDIVSIHDAIHEIPGNDVKKAIFAAQAEILKPKGIQTYNSTFTTIGLGDSAFSWGMWKLKAFSYFGRSRNKDIVGIELHSPKEYSQMITESGLRIIYEDVKDVFLSLDALKAISVYPEFIIGVFRDMEGVDKYSLEEKSKALLEALKDQKIEKLPRKWHEIIALKP